MTSQKTVVNFSALYDFLRSTASFKDKKAIILNAMRKSLRPVAAQFKSSLNPQAGTGNLKRSFGVWAGITKTHGFTALAGARQFGKHKGHHAHLYEFGTKERKTKDGKNRGQVKAANQFSGTLGDSNKERSAESLKENLVKAFQQHVNRKTKKFNL